MKKVCSIVLEALQKRNSSLERQELLVRVRLYTVLLAYTFCPSAGDGATCSQQLNALLARTY